MIIAIYKKISTVDILYNGHLGVEITGRYRELAVVGRFQLE